MSSQRLNEPDKDLEKFIKFLALKSTQVVVQSRLGEKMQTQCNSQATGNDWFNIEIQDHPDIYADAKHALGLGPGQSILQRLPLCIEISLKTVEGDKMVLEVWSLDLQHSGGSGQQKDDRNEGKNISSNVSEQQTLKAAHAIYNRMGILLKSLISLTRATPAYKLSRRQCADSYKIYYRIYVDRPQIHTLGEGHKQVKIGQLNTTVGVLSMHVAYRTKMTITPTTAQARNDEGNTIMLKSDHFRPADATSPTKQPIVTKKVGAAAAAAAESKVIDIDKPMRPGAFTDMGKLRQYTEDDYVLPETPPFEWLLRRTRNESSGDGSIESLNRLKCESPSATPLGNGHQHNINNNNTNCSGNNSNNMNAYNNNNNNNNNNLNAFKSLENDENTQKSPARSTNNLSQSPIKTLLIPTPPATRASSAKPAAHSYDEDNLLKELNFPFALTTSHSYDLAKFWRDCYHAPPLCGELQPEASSSSNNSSCNTAAVANVALNAEACVVEDLSRQLEQFETSLEYYDELVSQLGLTTSSSTGSRSSGGGGGLQMISN